MAALVLSALALVVAVAAAVFSRRQANAAVASLHETRRPVIELTVRARGDLDPPSLGVLTVLHRQGPDLAELAIRIPERTGSGPGLAVPAFWPSNLKLKTLRWVAQGDSREVDVTLNPWPSAGPAVFVLVCSAARGKPWTITETVEPTWGPSGS